MQGFRVVFKTCLQNRAVYRTKRNNDEFHSFILAGVNDYLDTDFSEKDMEKIYTYLGNACDHEKTLKFIESGYDMSVLKD